MLTQVVGAADEVVRQLTAVGEPVEAQEQLAHVGGEVPVDLVVGLVGAVVHLAVVGTAGGDLEAGDAAGHEAPAVLPRALRRLDLVAVRDQVGVVRADLVEPRHELRRSVDVDGRALCRHELDAVHGGDPAHPVRVALGDEVPGADAPVVPAVRVAELLGGVEDEHDRAVRPVVAHLHRLGGGERGDHGAGVVEAGAEVGVVMRVPDDHLAVLLLAGQRGDDVVALAALVGHGHVDVALEGGHGLAGLDLTLEPVAVLLAHVDERDEAHVVLAVVGAQGVRSDRIPRVGWVVHVGAVGEVAGEDDGAGAVLGSLGALEVEPEVVHRAVDDDDLAGDVHALVVGCRAVAEVDHFGGDAVFVGAGYAAELGADQGPAADGDAGAAHGPFVDGDGLEAYVPVARRAQLGREVASRLVVRPGATEAKAERRGAEAVQVRLHVLWIALGVQLVDCLVVGHRGGGGGQQKRDCHDREDERESQTSVVHGTSRSRLTRTCLRAR